MNIDFNHLSPDIDKNSAPNASAVAALWQNFYHRQDMIGIVNKACHHLSPTSGDFFANQRTAWQAIKNHNDDRVLTDWLIALFNGIYAHHDKSTPTELVRGDGEPEYFAPLDGKPARIEFAHGFFQSALHEISHWCVAGSERRQQNDFGYWYISDGRDEISQRKFEQVEIKPQAIECLLSLALGRYFYVSADNLNATFDTTSSTFAEDVFIKASQFLEAPNTLPPDAKCLIWLFFHINFA